jgi:cytochrome b
VPDWIVSPEPEVNEHTDSRGDVRGVRVWDAPVRIFHWLLVVLVTTSWVSSEIGDDALQYHMWSGYALLTLVASRIVWGFVGSEHARFSAFVRGPRALLRYGSDLLRSNPPYYLGHNPLGGVSVILMLTSVMVQGTTGLFAKDDVAIEGPLVYLVTEATSSLLTTIHRYNFYVLATLIAVHIAAVLFYLLVKGENLIAAMFTGRKQVAQHSDLTDGRVTSPWLAVVIVIAIAGALAVLLNWR